MLKSPQLSAWLIPSFRSKKPALCVPDVAQKSAQRAKVRAIAPKVSGIPSWLGDRFDRSPFAGFGLLTDILSDCQKLDRNSHKILCKSFDNPKRYGDGENQIYIRGLFFPGGTQPPKFVWVKINREYNTDEGIIYEVPQYKVYFKDGIDRVSTNHNVIQARSMVGNKNEELFFICGYMAMDDTPNLATKGFTRGGACGAIFRGPWLMMRQYSGKPISSSDRRSALQNEKAKASDKTVKYTYEDAWRDISMRDVRSPADCFTFAQRDGDETVVMGTVLLSTGHQQECQTQSNIVERAFKLRSGMFRDNASGIANLLGIPRFVLECNAGSEADGDFRNLYIARLMTDIHSTTTGPQPNNDLMLAHIGDNGFGSTHIKWSCDEAESNIIVRADVYPILATHLEALLAYIRDEIEPCLKTALQGLPPGAIVNER